MSLIYTHSFKKLLEKPESIGLIWLAMGSQAVAESSLAGKPSAFVLDLQHGLWDRLQLEVVIGVLDRHCPIVVRVKSSSATHISEALDAGASSVLVPYIETVDQAKSAISAAHYPPFGVRSAGGVRPLSFGVDSMIESGKNIAVGLMIETVAGYEQVDEIASLSGLDYLLIGTGDLALSLGDKANQLEDYLSFIKNICHKYDLPCGVFTPDAETASRRFHQGYAMAVIANDISIVQCGFAAVQRFFKE